MIKNFIEATHYTRSVFGVTAKFCFCVLAGERVVGGAIFGDPSGAGVLTKYSEGGRFKTTELRRFVLADECPKNSESRVLGVMLRRLKRLGVCRVLSYADPSFGHSGVIYSAVGFKLVGKTSRRKHYMWKGRKYPDRNLHQTNFPFHKELRAAVASGEAAPVSVPGKNIWVRTLTA